jgi:hypothetical protein
VSHGKVSAAGVASRCIATAPNPSGALPALPLATFDRSVASLGRPAATSWRRPPRFECGRAPCKRAWAGPGTGLSGPRQRKTITEENWLTARPDRTTRRSFLAAGGKAALGLAGLRLAGNQCSGTGGGVLTAALAVPGQGCAVVTDEPVMPVNHTSYVSRPDLTPPGVAIRTSSAFASSGLQSHYIFCAPKSPLAANPDRLFHRTHSFPAGATPGLMILDTTGELVWFKPLPGPYDIPFNFRVQTYEGRPVLTWFQGKVVAGHGQGHYVLADDSYTQFAEVTSTGYPCDLHEFILTPEGTALHTAYDDNGLADNGLPLFIGHAQEVDVATNELLFDWPCYPAVSPELSYKPPYGDYFHINSIDLWPGPERNLLISSRNTCAVYLVDRQTKRALWRLGGKQSDFSMGPGTRFYFQHDARALADGSGVSLFDDASKPCPENVASGKVITLDQGARTAALRHRYLHTDHEFITPSQGNCQVLATGAHVVGWGYLPFFSAYAASGDDVEAPLILDGRTHDGAASYRTFLFNWTGHPLSSELRLVVKRAAGSGNFTGWVSWNGATQVDSWQLSAGPSPTALATVALVKRRGFETAIDFTQVGATAFDVVALDASGAVLGRSALVGSDN